MTQVKPGSISAIDCSVIQAAIGGNFVYLLPSGLLTVIKFAIKDMDTDFRELITDKLNYVTQFLSNFMSFKFGTNPVSASL